MIDNVKKQGIYVESGIDRNNKDNLVNIVGNIVGDIETFNEQTKEGKKFTVTNFSIVSKDENNNKVYTNCSAYGEKSNEVRKLNEGDFVKIFG